MLKEGFLDASMKYSGISPWEAEVIYGLFSERFSVRQDEIADFDPDFVSAVSLSIPLEFNEAFFKWFEYKRWDKVKFILKEMKRRRGKNNALKIELSFLGTPNIGFVLDVDERGWFDSALEKMDFVIELLPFQMDSLNMPHEVSSVVYGFDVETRKWKMRTIHAGDKKFRLVNDTWKAFI